MKPQLLMRGLLLFTFLAGGVAAQVQKPGPSPSDALFDPSRVIQIEIRLDPKDWHALRISHPILDSEGNIPPGENGCEFYRGDVVIDGEVIKSVGVRKKGSDVAFTALRPSFKIKFDEYAKGKEFLGLDALTLNSLMVEPTKAHQSLAYSFLRKAGVITPRSNLVRVTANGEDLGIYGHVESIRKPFIKRHFSNAQGDLYEGAYTADFTTNGLARLEHKWGPDTGLSKARELMEVLESLGLVSLKRVEELVDLDAFINSWAATVLIGHVDSYPGWASNYHVYRDAKSGKFFWIPWGADGAFKSNPAATIPVPKSLWARGHLCRRLWELSEIRERYRKEMRRLLADVWDEKSMLAELNLVRRLCENDRPRDFARGNKAVESITRFIERRRKEVQAELDLPAPDWSLRRPPIWRATLPSTNGTPMQVEGSFSAVIAEAIPTNAAGYFGRGTSSLHFTVDGKTRDPFTQSGAVATTGIGDREVTGIHITVADTVRDLRWHLRFRIDSYRVAPGTLRIGYYEDWAVTAALFQGDPGPKVSVKGDFDNTGSLELTQVSTNLGGTISGKFKINTTAFEEEKKP